MANRVAEIFRSLGYEYILIDSGSPPTQASPQADELISSDSADEFDLTLWNSTLLKPFVSDLLSDPFRFRHDYNLNEVAKVAERETATFTLAHFMLPHPPFVFNRKGKPAEPYELKMTPDRGTYLPPDPKYLELYLDQLIYTNELMKDLVENILSQSKISPIIILQSDHGSWPAMKWQNSEVWLKERMPILNAYHLPGDGKTKLYPAISPVNTFRLIFNHYFNTPLQLYEDKIYYHHPHEWPFEFTDVTDVLLSDAVSTPSS